MGRRVVLAVVFLLMAVSSPAQHSAGNKNIVRDRELVEKFDQGKKWTVVIGVNKYLDPAIPSLKFCVADARCMAETLVKHSGYSEERVLVIADDQREDHLQPLGFNLREQINLWLRNPGRGDTLLVFFSGHGFLDNEGQGFLAPKDCKREKLGLTGFRTDDLRDMLVQCDATQKVLILDCCHAGGGKGTDSGGASSAELGAAFEQARGLITLASCQQEEQSQEWEENRQGLFTYFVTKGLEGAANYDGNGVVDSDELYRYTADNVPVIAQRVLNTRQTPVRFIPSDVVGVFPLARVPETRRYITAKFTVREGDEKGPLLPGVKLELFYRQTAKGELVVLGIATSDTAGRAAVSTWLDGKQQTRGSFLVLVNSGGGPQTFSLPGFPTATNWNLYVPGSKPVLPSMMPTQEKPNRPIITNSIGMKLLFIPAGEFQMGCADWEDDTDWGERPQHRVRITKPFYLGATEVTQEQYERVMGENPSNYKGDSQRPVETVSWEEAVEFCRRLSQQEGKTYRLPTEAQWEYACRAGSTAKWHFGDEESRLGDHAWYDSNSDSTAHPVGQKKANAWGLYDMHGNVYEWCADWYDFAYYGESPSKNPTGPASALYRVHRGGSWLHDAKQCRSAYRFWSVPAIRDDRVGFRVALVPSGS